MIVHVDVTPATPIFEQLRSQVERLILSRQLRPGTRLPPIRQLAADLDLARGTVAKVYDALARDGLVESAGRHGTVVLEVAVGSARVSDLDAAADSLALVAHQLGLPAATAHRALEEALARWRPGPDGVRGRSGAGERPGGTVSP